MSLPANLSTTPIGLVKVIAAFLWPLLVTALVATSLHLEPFQEHPNHDSFAPPPRNSFRPVNFKRASSTSGDMIVHEREFVSPQVRVQMDCQRDKTLLRVNFSQPFHGIVGAGRPETTKCKLLGNGTKLYMISLPHNASSDCDAQWDSASSSIFNTLFIRFHSALETGGDIAKNIMCRLAVGDLLVGRRPLKASKPLPKPITESTSGQPETESSAEVNVLSA